MFSPLHNALSMVALAGLIGSPAMGAALIYEPFDYSPGAFDNASQAGGTGLTGAWSGTGASDQWDVTSGGLTFTGLSTTGNAASRISASGNSASTRSIDGAALTSLTPANGMIFFTVLVQDTNFSSGNSNGAMMIVDGTLTGGAGDPLATGSLSGFGVSFNDLNVHAIVAAGAGSSNSAVLIPNAAGDDNTYLLLGQIDWVSAGNDTLTLYQVTDVNNPFGGASVSIQADINQGNLSHLLLGSRQIETFDEIRFGLTVGDVGLIPEPSSLALLGLGGLMIARRRRG